MSWVGWIFILLLSMLIAWSFLSCIEPDEACTPDLDTGQIRYLDVSHLNNGFVYDLILECKAKDGTRIVIKKYERVVAGRLDHFEKELEAEWYKYCRKHGKYSERVRPIGGVKEMASDIPSLSKDEIDFLLSNRE